MSDWLPEGTQRVLVTGGAGFIGGAMVRGLLLVTGATVFNLGKLGYSSDLTSISEHPRHQLLRVDLANAEATEAALRPADPDKVMHLAAESHVDRSIDGPGAFIESNVTGTFNLLQALRAHWEKLPSERQQAFRFHHISSTDDHDRRYGIDAGKITAELGWTPWHSFEEGLEVTMRWYLHHLGWCRQVRDRAVYSGERIDPQASAAAA